LCCESVRSTPPRFRPIRLANCAALEVGPAPALRGRRTAAHPTARVRNRFRRIFVFIGSRCFPFLRETEGGVTKKVAGVAEPGLSGRGNAPSEEARIGDLGCNGIGLAASATNRLNLGPTSNSFYSRGSYFASRRWKRGLSQKGSQLIEVRKNPTSAPPGTERECSSSGNASSSSPTSR
jgi:hypothetical protein